MYNFIFLAIILISLAIIVYIVLPKIPSLANLDVNNLPEELEQKKKKEIVINRLENKGKELGKKIVEKLYFLKNAWVFLQDRFRLLVHRIEKLWRYEESVRTKEKDREMTQEEKDNKLKGLIKEAENFFTVQNYDKAEEFFIAALRLDPKSPTIYRGLADTYLAKKSYNEAAETYEFLLTLNKDDDNVLMKLGEIKETQNKLDEAINYYQQAAVIGDSLSPRFFHLAELLLKINQNEVAKEAIVEACALESKNPKYLDLLIETAIICGDKLLAEKGWEDLRIVNPENNKLSDFRERIDKLS
ncbi:MAG TPA: tetratricopeptide repeat protein [Candidatus Magasanikbacteria bacterium]|nr:tetratricopeptide repeat protein [Candidatus Magasanikbacteria bacterium]